MENKPKFHPNPKLKLMDQVREVLRYHHYAYRTEQTYCQWILRYIHHFGGKTHPRHLGAKDIEVFLSHLATEGKVSGATQRQALNAIVAQIASVLDRAPVLITQHMPPTFTTILAEHLARLTKRPVREAAEGEEVNAGTIYLAPGGRHMSVVRHGGIAVIALGDGALVNFCKPAVDPLFSSAAEVWGPKVLALVLTGMGSDGLRGSQAIAAAGGCIVAQDEASSVVWGMPGQVAHAGLCSAVLPLDEIAPRLTRLFTGEKS